MMTSTRVGHKIQGKAGITPEEIMFYGVFLPQVVC